MQKNIKMLKHLYLNQDCTLKNCLLLTTEISTYENGHSKLTKIPKFCIHTLEDIETYLHLFFTEEELGVNYRVELSIINLT